MKKHDPLSDEQCFRRPLEFIDFLHAPYSLVGLEHWHRRGLSFYVDLESRQTYLKRADQNHFLEKRLGNFFTNLLTGKAENV